MMHVRILGIGVVAGGLPDWPATRAVLRGEQPYEPAPLARYAAELLPANERRRLTPAVRLALQAATEATAAHPELRERAASVFVSESGDLGITERMCRALAQENPMISPVDFHNSVHNAASGYWAIASRCRAPSTSLSAGPGNLAAGLLECAMQSQCSTEPVLLVAFELPPPEDLRWPGAPREPFACALLLHTGDAPAALATLQLTPESPAAEARETSDSRGDPALRALAEDNKASAVLPLLALIAGNRNGRIRLPLSYNAGLGVEVVID
ncbi:MAG: beta-ketoacyl synthase chain length factor [Burkholderiaceae bacterium]